MAFVILPVAAVIHVVEEWRAGFVAQVGRFVPGVSMAHFWLINAAFVTFCVVASIAHRNRPVVALSAMALIGVNALIHLAGALLARGYSPGVVSAGVLYVPLTAWTFRTALAEGHVTRAQALRAVGLGAVLMTVPFVFQALRLLLRL